MTIQQWAKRFIDDENLVSRGRNRRQKTRAEIHKQLKAESGVGFPVLTTLQLIWWAWWIWRELRRSK